MQDFQLTIALEICSEYDEEWDRGRNRTQRLLPDQPDYLDKTLADAQFSFSRPRPVRHRKHAAVTEPPDL